MSEDAIKALEALRSAALESWTCAWVDRAIATLRAEQPPESNDTLFLPPLGTVRACIDCDALVAGGPTRCRRCAKDVRAEQPAHRMEDRCAACFCPRRLHVDNQCIGNGSAMVCHCRGWREPAQPAPSDLILLKKQGGFFNKNTAPAQACAGFVCATIGNNCTDPGFHGCACGTCGQPISAHQPSEQPVSRVAKTVRREGKPGVVTPTDADLDDLALATKVEVHGEQPAPKIEVPPLALPAPYSLLALSHVSRDYFTDACDEAKRQHAAAVALAERCETLQADFTAAMREATAARRAQGEAEGKLAASEMAGVVEGWKERCERAEREYGEMRRERNDALVASGHDESLARRMTAERDEANAQLAETQRLLGISRSVETRLLAGLDEALNATKRLRAQLAEAQAALRDARRQERERCAKVCEQQAEEARRVGANFDSKGDPERGYAWGHRQSQAYECGRLIRALPEEVEP